MLNGMSNKPGLGAREANSLLGAKGKLVEWIRGLNQNWQGQRHMQEQQQREVGINMLGKALWLMDSRPWKLRDAGHSGERTMGEAERDKQEGIASPRGCRQGGSWRKIRSRMRPQQWVGRESFHREAQKEQQERATLVGLDHQGCQHVH